VSTTRVVSTTRNGDTFVVETKDRAEANKLENAPFDPNSNIASTSATEVD
jgi:hypothetical protein